MAGNPFRPVQRESYEEQLDMSALPNKQVDETDELVDIGLSSSQQTADMMQQSKFLESSTSTATPTGGAIGPNGTARESRSAAQGNSGQADAVNASGLFARLCTWFSVEYYQPYFDVSTTVVMERIKLAASPHKNDLFGSTDSSPPDLYGAVWVPLTLVFLIGAASNLNSFLVHNSETEPWERDFRLLTFAATMTFAYAIVVPVLVWAASLYVGVDPRPSLIKLIGLYGYSMTLFVPASLLCVIPYGAVQWIVVLVAGGLSGVVLIRNLYTLFGTSYSALSQTDIEVQTSEDSSSASRSKSSFLLITGAAFIHVVFALMLKLFFFQGADLSSTINPNNS